MNHRIARPARRWAAWATLGAAAFSTLLSGCNSLYSEGATAGAGIAGAAIASKVTSNAAVATGIGLGAVAGARAGVQYTQRVAHRYSQAQIAAAAGPLEVGGVAPWSTHHSFPIEDDEHGRVDLPPTNRASRSLVKFVFGEEDEHEEALYGTANHRVSEGSRGRYAGQGTVQEAWVQ
ncbi:putative lipoprotein [Burkholderia mallei]|uniref:hypothetical protein n=2 Tax=Burkholderia mallei TaxID=13373 RepID=UPI0005D7ABE1|nr:hypothetical protein [Burkholderia mallei]AJX44868.1 putative lipoprotein [Burkholderia mallei]AJX54811.1 putative lipoprotein [Burkholderia mallei]RPA41244.1 hypothetical protein EGT59_14355 [Burkholderia mallei]